MFSFAASTTQTLKSLSFQFTPFRNCISINQQLSSLISPFSLAQQLRFRYHYLRRRSRVKRDILRHKAVAEFEVPRMVFKAINRDTRLDMKTRLRAMLTLHSMHNYTCPTALKPRCVETGRGAGLVKGFGISRIVFREAAINGKLSGMIKAVW